MRAVWIAIALAACRAAAPQPVRNDASACDRIVGQFRIESDMGGHCIGGLCFFARDRAELDAQERALARACPTWSAPLQRCLLIVHTGDAHACLDALPEAESAPFTAYAKAGGG